MTIHWPKRNCAGCQGYDDRPPAQGRSLRLGAHACADTVHPCLEQHTDTIRHPATPCGTPCRAEPAPCDECWCRDHQYSVGRTICVVGMFSNSRDLRCVVMKRVLTLPGWLPRAGCSSHNPPTTARVRDRSSFESYCACHGVARWSRRRLWGWRQPAAQQA